MDNWKAKFIKQAKGIARDGLSPLGGGDNSPTESSALRDDLAFDDVLADSPMARKKQKVLEQQVEQLSMTLRKVVKLSKQVQQAGNIFRDVSNQFTQELLTFNNNHLAQSEHGLEASLQQTVDQLAHAMLEIHDYQAMLMVQLDNVFTQPMERFVKDEFRELKDAHKTHQRTRMRYDTSLSKFCHIKKTDVEKIPEAEHELLHGRREYQRASLSYVYKLKHVRTNAMSEYLERMCAYMYAEKAYFNQGHSLHQTVEPSLAHISSHLRTNRQYLEEQQADLKEKQAGVQLQSSIGSDTRPGLTQSRDETTTAVETAGYLFMKRGNKWKRTYVGIKDGHLVRYKNSKDSPDSAILLANLLICTVRPARDVERRFCFEVVSPSENFLLLAENDEILQHWIAVIQNAIANQLNQNHVSSKKQGNETAESRGGSGVLPQLEVVPGNKYCADCAATDPTWASINLGILICIECSGIHRQLGTHISKVRSTTLDSWEKEMIKLMQSIGNTASNAVYLETLPEVIAPPSSKCDRASREAWIRDKYERKLYVRVHTRNPEEQWHSAILSKKMGSVMRLLAQGADVNWKDPGENMTAPLHHAVEANDVSVCEYLLQNGADADIRDGNASQPLHYCARLNNVEIAILLIKRGAKLGQVNFANQTPLDIAIEKVHAHLVTLFRLARHAASEGTGNALEDESFAMALKGFSDEVESMKIEETTIPDKSALWTHDSDSDDDEAMLQALQNFTAVDLRPREPGIRPASARSATSRRAVRIPAPMQGSPTPPPRRLPPVPPRKP